MNSGQPSLLEAIFGKQDLSSVSLDEMYEVIREFPSFNAAHFLLARKLKQQQDAAYEKEAMRTALYFNNPFWLQSLLDEGTQIRQPQSDLPESPVSESYVKSDDGFEKYNTETPDELKNEGNYIFESYTPVQIPSDTTDELDEETEEILEEKAESESSPTGDTFQYAEPGPETVSSFDLCPSTTWSRLLRWKNHRSKISLNIYRILSRLQKRRSIRRRTFFRRQNRRQSGFQSRKQREQNMRLNLVQKILNQIQISQMIILYLLTSWTRLKVVKRL
jgi:hypothetical protein